jgi:AraC-like DNA-binding protein
VGPVNRPVVSWGAPHTEHAERADAVRNRRHLLATAREMIAKLGPDRLTMDALAERSGLGKGTVFRRFGPARGSSRRCWTTVSVSSRSRCCPGHHHWARALRRCSA